MTQQALGRRDDQRFSQSAPILSAEHLAAQQMEILRRRGAVRHAHIVFGAELQKSLQTGARMLRTLAFLPVR